MNPETDELSEKLETMLREAKPVPLTDQVRIDKRRAQLLISDLRAHLAAERRRRGAGD